MIRIYTHEDFGDSLAKLIAVVREINSCPDQEIILNFSRSKMLNPFFLGGLVCVINRLKALGKNILLTHDENYSINSYLKTICFPETFSSAEGKEKDYLKALESYSLKTHIPIIRFKTGRTEAITVLRENILSAVSQLLKNQ